jgi:hypothetical protein
MADVPNPDELTQLQAAFPSLGELTRLPPRALVVYAARCARRVQPFFTLPDDHPERQRHLAAVERAIQTAEEFARGVPVTSEAAFQAEKGALKATGDAKAFNLDAAAAAWAALQAVKTVQCAAAKAVQNAAVVPRQDLEHIFPEQLYGPIAWPEGTSAHEAFLAFHAWYAAAAWAAAAEARAAVAAAVHADFEKLRGQGLGRFPELGEPLDPSADGPLGPLWPEETL